MKPGTIVNCDSPQDVAIKKERETYKIDNIEMAALGDRILIKEDEFRTGYECSVCGGKGKYRCTDCDGTGRSHINPEITCKGCNGQLMQSCVQCGGKGALIFAPETSERRPSTGQVVSIGPLVTNVVVGDSVLYSNFSGYAMEINGEVIRIVHQPELLAWIKGHLTVRRSLAEGQDSHDWLNNRSLDTNPV